MHAAAAPGALPLRWAAAQLACAQALPPAVRSSISAPWWFARLPRRQVSLLAFAGDLLHSALVGPASIRMLTELLFLLLTVESKAVAAASAASSDGSWVPVCKPEDLPKGEGPPMGPALLHCWTPLYHCCVILCTGSFQHACCASPLTAAKAVQRASAHVAACAGRAHTTPGPRSCPSNPPLTLPHRRAQGGGCGWPPGADVLVPQPDVCH